MKVKHLQKKLETRIRAMPANQCSVSLSASISSGTSGFTGKTPGKRVYCTKHSQKRDK